MFEQVENAFEIAIRDLGLFNRLDHGFRFGQHLVEDEIGHVLVRERRRAGDHRLLRGPYADVEALGFVARWFGHGTFLYPKYNVRT